MRRQITGLHAADRCAADQQPGQRKPGDAAVFDDEILQIPARRTAAGISWRSDREGVMSLMRPDPPDLRLDPTLYETLRQAVLKRDGWRCQSCGTMSNLEIHYKQFRSHSGDDSEENLVGEHPEVRFCSCEL
jgi:hypothetical protein